MTAPVNQDKLELASQALEQADNLVTLVIKGDSRSSRAALELARTLHDIKRKHGSLKLEQ